MNCKTFRKRQAELLDTNPDPAATADLIEHVAACPECARLNEEALGVLCALRPSNKLSASSETKERIMDRVADMDARSRAAAPKATWWTRGRRVWAGAVAAMVVMAGVGIGLMTAGSPALSTLAQAAEFFDSVKSMHIVAKMRTIDHENFDYIKLNVPLIPVEMWVENSEPPKWRVEKASRVVVDDGDATTLLIGSGAGAFARRWDGAAGGVAGWLEPLLDLSRLCYNERALAWCRGSRIDVGSKTGPDGRPKTVLTVRAKAQGDFSHSDYLKNKSVTESDNIRVYTFDAETQRWEKLSVFVQTAKGNVLVFETTRIEYDRPMPASTFALDIPDNATWIKDPYELAGTPDTSKMTPDAAARAFFEACAKSDWVGARVFAGSFVDNPQIQDWLGGLKLISIGKPFKSGQYPGWFVPYEIKLKSGEIKQYNLAIRNDTPRGLWMVDGGI
jgi:hypothetical protein